jgi:hypothetical protein
MHLVLHTVDANEDLPRRGDRANDIARRRSDEPRLLMGGETPMPMKEAIDNSASNSGRQSIPLNL